jgi:hypothetical protein
MLRRDFQTGGFPLRDLCPVLCIGADDSLHIVYNKFDFITLLQTKNIRLCCGVWPGKKTTDGFVLDPKAYASAPKPPEEHKDIDNAEAITVIMEKSLFSKLRYSLKDQTPIESRDSDLLEYIKKSGLRFSLVFE